MTEDTLLQHNFRNMLCWNVTKSKKHLIFKRVMYCIEQKLQILTNHFCLFKYLIYQLIIKSQSEQQLSFKMFSNYFFLKRPKLGYIFEENLQCLLRMYNQIYLVFCTKQLPKQFPKTECKTCASTLEGLTQPHSTRVLSVWNKSKQAIVKKYSSMGLNDKYIPKLSLQLYYCDGSQNTKVFFRHFYL